MRREPEFFGEVDLPLLYIAKRLREALRLEEVLTAAGLDYVVEPDTYRGGMIFVSERIGAFFYVAPAEVDRARSAMSAAGFKPWAGR